MTYLTACKDASPFSWFIGFDLPAPGFLGDAPSFGPPVPLQGTLAPLQGARATSTFFSLPIQANVDLVNFLTVSFLLFLIGITGIFLNRKNIIIILMCIELMLLAVNLNFIVFSVYLGDFVGELFALFILTVAAAEAAIGLAILVVYYRVRGTIAVEFLHLMKG